MTAITVQFFPWKLSLQQTLKFQISYIRQIPPLQLWSRLGDVPGASHSTVIAESSQALLNLSPIVNSLDLSTIPLVAWRANVKEVIVLELGVKHLPGEYCWASSPEARIAVGSAKQPIKLPHCVCISSRRLRLAPKLKCDKMNRSFSSWACVGDLSFSQFSIRFDLPIASDFPGVTPQVREAAGRELQEARPYLDGQPQALGVRCCSTCASPLPAGLSSD